MTFRAGPAALATPLPPSSRSRCPRARDRARARPPPCGYALRAGCPGGEPPPPATLLAPSRHRTRSSPPAPPRLSRYRRRPAACGGRGRDTGRRRAATPATRPHRTPTPPPPPPPFRLARCWEASAAPPGKSSPARGMAARSGGWVGRTDYNSRQAPLLGSTFPSPPGTSGVSPRATWGGRPRRAGLREELWRGRALARGSVRERFCCSSGQRWGVSCRHIAPRLHWGPGEDWARSACGERGAFVPHLCGGKASTAFAARCNGALLPGRCKSSTNTALLLTFPREVFSQAPKNVVALVWEVAALQFEGVLKGLGAWVYWSSAYPEKINTCLRNAGARDSDCVCVFLLAVV